MFGLFKKKGAKSRTGNPDTILGRVTNLLKSNIHAALDNAEDPAKMADQLVRDYRLAIQDSREAVQKVITNVRLSEAQQAKDVEEQTTWLHRAQLAASRSQAQRDEGDISGAASSEKLARQALQRQIAAEKRIESRTPQLQSQNSMIEDLKTGLSLMEDRINEVEAYRDSLVMRTDIAHTQSVVADAFTQVNASDPLSPMAALERSVQRREAEAQGKVEIANNTLEAGFQSLEAQVDGLEVNDRLQALLGNPTKQIKA